MGGWSRTAVLRMLEYVTITVAIRMTPTSKAAMIENCPLLFKCYTPPTCPSCRMMSLEVPATVYSER